MWFARTAQSDVMLVVDPTSARLALSRAVKMAFLAFAGFDLAIP